MASLTVKRDVQGERKDDVKDAQNRLLHRELKQTSFWGGASASSSASFENSMFKNFFESFFAFLVSPKV